VAATQEELEQAALAAEEDGRKARLALERVAASNARIARALHVARGGEATDPTPFDVNPLVQLAERATGLSREEQKALADDAWSDVLATPPSVNPRAAIRRRMVDACVPELYIRHVGDVEPRECDALRLVREHLERRPGGFLVLAGGKGVFKTGSACWMLGQVDGGVFVEACDLLDLAFHDRPMFLRLRRAKYVVLDELGGEDVGEGNDAAYFRRALNKLCKGWYANAATVIVTGNIRRSEFDAYGERIKSCMDERGQFFTVGGEDQRRSMRSHWLDAKEGKPG